MSIGVARQGQIKRRTLEGTAIGSLDGDIKVSEVILMWGG
jgi:hypothetical protein